MMSHSFDTTIVVKYGINQAIMLGSIYSWVEKNIQNDENCFEGRYWTYNSIKAFTEQFPFWSERQIRDIISKLKENELIEIGCFNENKFDKTAWYTLTEKGFALFGENPYFSDVTKMSHRCDENVSVPNNYISLSNEEEKDIYNNKLNNNNINSNIDILDNIKIYSYNNTHTHNKTNHISNLMDNKMRACACVRDVPEHLKKINVLSVDENGVYEIDFEKNFNLMIEGYPKSEGITASRKIIAEYLTNGIKGVKNVTLSMISLAVRQYVSEYKERNIEVRYLKKLDNFLKSDDLIDYIIATRKKYIAGMLKYYGSEWEEVKFKYRGMRV